MLIGLSKSVTLPDSCALKEDGGSYVQNYESMTYENIGVRFSESEIREISNLNFSSESISSIVRLSWYVVLIFVISIISLITFSCFCCYCDRYSSGTSLKMRVFIFIAGLLLAGIIVLTILSSVKVSNVPGQSVGVICSLIELPSTLVEGSNNNQPQFNGFEELAQIFLNISNEFENIQNFEPELNQIKNNTVSDSVPSATSALSTFNNSFKDQQTFNSKNGDSTPNSVQQFNEEGYEAILTEFEKIDGAGTTFTKSAESALKMINGGDFQSTKEVIISIYNNINDILTQLKSLNTKTKDAGDTLDESYPILVIIFGVLLFIMTGICIAIGIFLLFSLLRGKDCCRLLIKFFMILTAFLLILYSILTIFFYFAGVTSNSFCFMIGDTLNSDDVAAKLNYYGINVPDNMTAYVNTCLSTAGDGNLSSFLPNDKNVLDDIESFLAGFNPDVPFDLDDIPTSSPTIKTITDTFLQIREGLIPDHSEVIETLKSFNEQISCANQSAFLDESECSGASGCFGIRQTSSYTPPSCSNSSETSTLFSNLRLYLQDTEALLLDATNQLSVNSNSANERIKPSYTEINNIVSKYDQIKTSLGKTVDSAKRGMNIKENYNCQVLRTQVNNISNNLCLEFSKNMSSISIILVIYLYLIIGFLWLTCCALRMSPDRNGEAGHSQGAMYQEQAQFKNTTDMQNLY